MTRVQRSGMKFQPYSFSGAWTLVLGAFLQCPSHEVISLVYQCSNSLPANTHTAAASAIYGPYGNREPRALFRVTIRAIPTSAPSNELITSEKITACQPRNAP